MQQAHVFLTTQAQNSVNKYLWINKKNKFNLVLFK